MKIKGDKIQIYRGPVDKIGGAGPEPEERPAQRTIDTDIPVNSVSIEDPNDTKTPFFKRKSFRGTGESIQGQISAAMTAGEIADSLSTTCRFCRWWNHDRVVSMVARLSHDTAPQALQKLNEIRGTIMGAGLTGLDVENALRNDVGYCEAYSSIFGDDVLTHAMARCPASTPEGIELPRMFEPRNAQARKDANAVRDAILRGKNRK